MSNSHRCLWWSVTTSVLLLASARSAQAGHVESEGWTAEHYTTEHGLPQNFIRALAQTPDGYLWIGTISGLARFDGDRFTVFDHANTPEMGSDAINRMLVDRDGTLWIGTKDGLLEWRGRLIKCWSSADGLPGHRDVSVEEIFECPQGGLWFRRGRNVCLLHERRVTVYGSKEALHISAVVSIGVTRRGELIAMDELGLQRLGRGGRFESLIERKRYDAPTDFTELLNGDVWMSGVGGCWRLSASNWLASLELAAGGGDIPSEWQPRWDRDQEKIGLSGNSSVFLVLDRHDRLWSWSTPEGLQQWNGERFHPVKIPNLSLDSGMASLLEDREGNVWIGTAGDGLLRLRPQRIRTWTTKDGLPANAIRTVCAGPDGSVWAATRAGPVRIHQRRVERLPAPDVASAVFASRSGWVMLIQHYVRAYRWKDGNYQGLAGLSDSHVSAICEDRRGHVWLGPDYWDDAAGDTVNRSPLWKRFRFSVQTMQEDRTGRMWFGMKNAGLSIWDGSNVMTLRRSDGLCDDSPTAFYEDREGLMWIGFNSGLNRLKDGKLTRIRVQEGLSENTVNQILEDNEGNLWMGGLRGIQRVSRRELNDVADGFLEQVRCATYGELDGMVRSETNGEFCPAGAKTPDGHLWFPTVFGLVEADPVRLRECDIETPLNIELVVARGQVVFDSAAALAAVGSGFQDKRLTLPPGAGELIEIQFTAPSFFAPEKLRFQYLLQPRDKTWNNLDRQRSVFLQGLRPGDYEFQLRARDAHGRWSAHPAFLSFTVQAHLWDRAGFFPALLGTAVAAVAGLAAFRVRWQGQVLSARHERKLAEERARIARDLHDDLGTALTGVALDMDLTRRQAGGDVASRLSETAANVRALVQRMREVVWAVNPACDDVVSLVTFLEEQARAILEVGGLTVRIKFPEKLPEANLELETRYQLSLGLREAFTNILRHAGAKEVAIHMELQGSMLVLELHDDGRGFEPGAVRDRRGHGLDHLRVRMSQVGGQFDIQSRLGEGTTAILCVPFRPIKKKTARS